MTTPHRALLVCLLTWLPAAAQDYTYRVTGTVGALVPAAGWQTASFGTAPVVSVDHGFRFHRHGQFDAGIDAAFATQSSDDRHMTSQRHNIYIPRAGYRVVVPLKWWLEERIEAHIAFGGAYAAYKPEIYGYNTWLVYGQLGADYAFDRDRRYRAGTFVRWYRDPVGSPVQQWVATGAQITYCYGN